jgi:two-component system phosphate regulon sensor histidine kinase PhoR
LNARDEDRPPPERAAPLIDSDPVLLYEPGNSGAPPIDDWMPQGQNVLLEEVMEGSSPIKQLIEALPEAIILLGSRESVWFANASARDLLSVTQTQGPRAQFLRAPDVVDALGVATIGEIHKLRYRERVPFDRWIEVHVSRVDIETGELRQPLLVVLRDLTKSERIERMRADFVANVSHELRTPLASLAGFIETLKGAARDDADARQKFLDIMDSQAKRMSRLISDLLALSRIELDEHIQPATEVDLGNIAASVIETLKPAAEKSAVDLVLVRDGPVRILGSSDELSRLVENLVDNAIKYGGSGGRVEVGATSERDSEGEHALLRVKDFGLGIAPEHLPRLTERFYRVDASESRAKGGTGLGLALVKHIVARHRGRLTVQSSPGEGALFSARFDLSK